jgi:xanthine dehydrogenase YagR molybdenum-binding subunit
MAELDYSWPAPDKRQKIGKRTSRLDGPMKSAGRAKYAYDVNQPGQLQAVILSCPHAHARITSIDTSAAEKTPGFAALDFMAKQGDEIQYAGYEVVAVAADTLEHARDAARAVKVQYEVLPHLVHEHDLSKAGANAVPSGEQTTGDPEGALKQAEVVSDGFYAIPVLTHCCHEAHGQVIEWKGDKLMYWASTQAISSVGGDLAKSLQIPATQVVTEMQVMGGGFGSKFGPDRWATACSNLSKKAGGKAVKLFLTRAQDLEIAGNRPSYYANIKIGGSKDGLISVWSSESWATGGIGGQNLPAGQYPYVFKRVPNVSMKHTSVKTNAAPQRAWRAPNHPQLSFLTCCAMDDFAAKAGLDPLEVFVRNAEYAQVKEHIEVYRSQLRKAAELAEWKKLWHPRGQGASGPMKRGLGIGVNMWGGLGHASRCETTINPDGSVQLKIGSQDLGTGTRTIITMVAAETLGLPLGSVKLLMGSNQYPASGGSGGSTTVGGVSASTRKSTMNALNSLFEKVAPALGATPDQLEAVDGRIQVKGTPSKGIAWKDACAKLGTQPVVAMGENNQRGPGGLINAGVAGVQIADVSVDTETGIVRMNRMTAVQDCGLIINPKTAESQIHGAIIMTICGALYEERIMDQLTGRMLNADMEFYKLAGAGDIGEIQVHMNMEPEHDKRGVIGLGEPPVIGGLAAISNAVANAIGVRVPMLPLTPDRVLNALERRNA